MTRKLPDASHAHLCDQVKLLHPHLNIANNLTTPELLALLPSVDDTAAQGVLNDIRHPQPSQYPDGAPLPHRRGVRIYQPK